MKCPICGLDVGEASPALLRSSATHYRCSRCGSFALTGSAEAELPALLGGDSEAAALLSHLVRRLGRQQGVPVLSSSDLRALLAENEPPSPAQQVHNVVLWLGENTSPGEMVQLTPGTHRAVAGAVSDQNFLWLLRYLVNRGLFEATMTTGGAAGTLSFGGWELLAEAPAGWSGFKGSVHGYAVR